MTSCSNCGGSIETPVKFCPHCGLRVATAEPDAGLVGKTLADKYRLLEELGAGSMGTVYLAEHLGLKKKVAIKILHADLLVNDETLQRFQREGIAAGAFSHPNAIQIFDFDNAEGMYFLAMEYVEGENLSDYLRRLGALEPTIAIAILDQVLAALVVAHGHGIVHRDLKPENIMVLEGADGSLTVKVLDFGLSKLVDRPLGASLVTQVGQIMGTPLYMAPEQAGGDDVDHRSDLYSVGLILYEALTGRPPFQGGSITELLIKQATEPPPSIFEENPTLGVPQAVEDVIRRALEKLRENRFQSAADMRAALAAVDLAEPAGKAPKPSKAARSKRKQDARAGAAPARGLGRLVSLAVALVVVVTAAVALFGSLGGGSAAAETARVRQKEPAQRTETEEAYLGDLDQARSALEQGRFEAALALVESAAAKDCADAEASFVGGLVALADGDVDLARLELEEALERDPTYIAPAAELGWLALATGDLADARARFEACGDGAVAVAGLGAVALQEGDGGRALELLGRAATLPDADARVHRWLGRAHVEAGDLEAAREALLLAKKDGAQSAETHADLGRVYLALGRLEDAERELERAAELDPRAVDSLADLGAAYLASDRASDAIALLTDPVAANPRAASAAVVYATALEATGRSRDALEVLGRGLEGDAGEGSPALARGHLLHGILLEESGREREALDAYRRALALDDGLAVAHLNLGLDHFEAERFTEARDAFERAVERDDELVLAHYGLGVLYMDYLGDASVAADHLERYLELGGDDRRVGSWLERLGRRR